MAESAQPRQVCLIVGAGEGLGAAAARAFAREGMTVCLARRQAHAAELETLTAGIRAAGGEATPTPFDAADEGAVTAAFARIEREIGPLAVVVFNAASFHRAAVVDTSVDDYKAVWAATCLAGFLVLREAARAMSARGAGTILVTGATASLRGAANFSAFAAAKAALRATAQSLAREMGPKGVHVAHIVVDGAIDTPRVRGFFADAAARAERDALLKPDAIAANYVALHRQPRSAWSFELDVRPWSETW